MTIDRLRRFIGDMTSLVGGAWQDKDEAAIVEVGQMFTRLTDNHARRMQRDGCHRRPAATIRHRPASAR